jgi:outer membrane lipoprotein-sorting protein
MFILDSENKRILKFDLFGNFIQNFGGYDYGRYALNDPTGIAGDLNNNLFVIDGSTILIYDQFGNGIGEINGKENFSAINIIYNNMTINSRDNIYYYDLSHRTDQMEKISIDSKEISGDIKSTLIFNTKLYVLTSKEILIFQRP